MESIKEIYKIGFGPSSSHTIGPSRAAKQFAQKNPHIKNFRVTLYGSLALTGRGHMTDVGVIRTFKETLGPDINVQIVWKKKEFLPLHPNGMLLEAIENDYVTDRRTVYSIGGGYIKEPHEFGIKQDEVYPFKNMNEILAYVYDNNIPLWKVVDRYEPDVWPHLEEVWAAMKNAIVRGIREEDVLPGGLKLQRKAYNYLTKAKLTAQFASQNFIFAYALACSEENAAGNVVVTAPTCGSSGVLPAILYYHQQTHNFSDKRIYHALATAGLFGIVAKQNASISGAEVGCQGEIGVACAMASAGGTQLLGGSPSQIEYAAEMGLEHHLGLTCDPIAGLVQIPCIERNVMASARALDCIAYTLLSDGRHMISYDEVIETMAITGRNMSSDYRETAQGGLALILQHRFKDAIDKLEDHTDEEETKE